MTLDHNGERVILDQYQSSPSDWVIYLMHLAAYQFARPFVQGMRVLDYGCGSGYGAALVADGASQVFAVDVAEDAIGYARQHYARPNLTFQVAPAGSALSLPDASVDVVLSFQVIEHVADVDQYLSEIRRVLDASGCALIVTPDRRNRLFPLQRPWNRWHIREYGHRTLQAALRTHFGRVEIQQMSGPRGLVEIELRRYRKVRWLMLPATLPFVPNRLRVLLLNAVHAVRPRPRQTSGTVAPPFAVASIKIAHGASPSLNLVATARL